MNEQYDLTPIPANERPIEFTADSYQNISNSLSETQQHVLDMFHGGLYRLAKDNEVEVPSWMDSANEYMNREDIKASIQKPEPTKGTYQTVLEHLEKLQKHISSPVDPNAPWQKQALDILSQAINVLPPAAGARRPRVGGLSNERIAALQEKFKPMLDKIEPSPEDNVGKIKVPFKQAELDLIKALKEENVGAADAVNYFLPHRDKTAVWKRLTGKESLEEKTWPRGRPTTYNKEELERLIKTGKSYAEIADELGVTRNAVAGAVNRLGLGTGRSPNPAGRGAEFQGESVAKPKEKYIPKLAEVKAYTVELDAELEALLKKNPGASILDLLRKKP